MRPLGHLIKKETLLLLRDANALVLLFVMPAIFILIMSLALQNRFAAASGAPLPYYLVNQDSGAFNARLLDKLRHLKGFAALEPNAPVAALKTRMRSGGGARFLLVVPQGFGKALNSGHLKPLQVTSAADISPLAGQLFAASLRGAVGKMMLSQQMFFGGYVPSDKLVAMNSTYVQKGHGVLPSSVQQNVPAWLLFAMFFIAIPLSTTWVREREQGTYARLRTMGLSPAVLLAGKLVPYIVLNLLQVVLMLLVGIYVVPLLGGGSLNLGQSWSALALVSLVASFAAVSYALLVANLVSSSEQATIFTGVANLLMAALGGIMVPSFVMPHAMQAISHYSPMAWGLDGFLDVFLRGGGVAMVLAPAAKLAAFGVACLLATALWMAWRRQGKLL